MTKFRSSNTSGFTLIELMVVISIVVIVSGIGIASFATYSQTQTLSSVISSLASTLRTARSRTISQVIPSTCSGTFEGYVVSIAASSYSLFVRCGGINSPVGSSKTLPSSVTLSPTQTFTFKVSDNTVDGADPTNGTQITVSGYGKTKGVKVYRDGRITVN